MLVHQRKHTISTFIFLTVYPFYGVLILLIFHGQQDECSYILHPLGLPRNMHKTHLITIQTALRLKLRSYMTVMSNVRIQPIVASTLRLAK